MKQTMLLTILLTFSINIGLFANWIELQKVLASDGLNGNYFGSSVAIDRDYAVIGAFGDDDNGSNSGAVYIFHRTGNVWSEHAKLTASDGEQNDVFGRSVSIDGDYVVVGADWSDDNGEHSGSAYIFHRIGTTWVEEAKLTASDAATMDYFGYSVSISGDYVVVGAHRNDVNGVETGSAYIYQRTGHTWLEQQKISASDGEDGDLFGFSVSIDGDYILVGAYVADGSGYNPSYIFHRFGSVWFEQAILSSNDATNGDCYGKSVYLDGDYAVIGAYGDDDNGSNSGAAYIFHRNGITWSEQAKISASDGSYSDNFGIRVSISGNYAVISAYHDNDLGADSGSVYIFNRLGSTWTEQQKLTASDGEAYDLFGYSVCIDDDYVIVGAHYDDDSGDNSGSSYVFCNDDPLLPICLSSFTTIQTAENFALLNWTTQSESNLLGFNIFRNKIESIENSIILNPTILSPTNSSSIQHYSYTDEDIEFEQIYFYWLESVGYDGNTDLFGPVSLTIENPEMVILPKATILKSAYPNPFNPITTIAYDIKEGETGTLTILNIKGQKIVSECFVAGIYEFKWNAVNNASGIYFYKLQTESYSKINKLLLLR